MVLNGSIIKAGKSYTACSILIYGPFKEEIKKESKFDEKKKWLLMTSDFPFINVLFIKQGKYYVWYLLKIR
jgi:hypothetical protein